MINYKLLRTGNKPAPGELIILQGFVNTLDIEKGVDEIGTKELLKSWLIRHGLIQKSTNLSSKNLKTAISLREALRTLLLANNGKRIQPGLLNQINALVSQFKLEVSFNKEGMLTLLPNNHGFPGVCELIIIILEKSISEGTWSRMKACTESNCKWAFYDNSKNHSGRWCSMSVCGSRDKARAYRRRRSAK
jgi:predicted RNA-binding Zn ribbon-like protein